MHKYMLSILLMASVQWTLQSQTLKQWLMAADQSFTTGDFYEAFTYYEVAIKYDENRTESWEGYAESALKFKAYKYAEQAYNRIVQLNPEDKMAQYWLAFSKHRQGKYQSAADWYTRFLTGTPDSLQSFVETATIQLENCNFALIEIEEPKEMEIIQLDTSIINTPDSEFGPYQIDDTLYYSSLSFLFEKDDHNPPRTYSKILTSVKESSKEEIDAINETGKHVSNTAFNENRSKLFYTICEYVNDEAIRCDLFCRKRYNNGAWGPPVMVDINEGGATTTHPSIGRDQSTGKEILFFVSDRYGGKGGLDIWAAHLEADGSVGEPFNLEEINTTHNDITPFFHTESQRLYFSSEGYESFGGYDIYNSQFVNGEWSMPYNMGAPLNSSYDEAYYYRSDCTDAYFSSNRWGSVFLVHAKETCCNDIYKVVGKVTMSMDALTYDAEDGSDLLGATLKLYEVIPDGEDILLDSIIKTADNFFTFEIERCKDYSIEASKRGYRTTSIPINLGELSKEFDENIPSEYEYPEKITKKIKLDPLKAEIVIKPCDAEDPSAILKGVIARFSLINPETGDLELLSEKKQNGEAELAFFAYVNKTYQLQLEKEGYLSRIDTFEVTDETIFQYGEKIKIDACIDRDPFPPVIVYFDNNVPAKHPNTYTNSIYDELFESYYGKKQEFVENYTEDMTEGEQFRLSRSYESFFDRQVKIGELQLERFASKLLDFLEEDNTFKIKLKGYSSPRGQSAYNELLSSRRIDSVINYFEEFGGGAFKSYIDSGKLEFIMENFGESTAAAQISDDLKDRKNSIYSVVASVERRVEITVIKTDNE